MLCTHPLLWPVCGCPSNPGAPSPAVPPEEMARLEAAMVELQSRHEQDPAARMLDGDTDAIAELLRQADAEACQRSLSAFVELFWPELEPNGRPLVKNAGTDAIVQHLQAVGDGQIQRLGICVSPGFGKTTLCSIAYPAWRWARDPSWRVICASHAFELARDIAQKFHRLVTSDKYQLLFPHVALEQDAMKAMGTTRSGMRYAVGVGGALTGLRANAGCIDDSLNAIDAGSSLAVDRVNEWHDQAFSTRFDDREQEPASVVVVQQRLAVNDLINHIREQGAEILELPARFEVGRRCVTSIWQDPREREGQILAPEIHSEAFLEERLRILRPHGFAGQYGQRPGVREGNQFKVGMWNWLAWMGEGAPSPHRPKGARATPAHVLRRRKDGSLELDWLCVSVDPTGGSIQDDASALGLGIIGGMANRVFVLEDMTPGPRTFGQQVRDIVRAILRAGQLAGRQPRFTCLVEKKALGVGCMEKIQAAVEEGRFTDDDGKIVEAVPLLYPDGSKIICRVKPYEPSGKGSKELRADHMEGDIDGGMVYLPEDAVWVPAWLEEFGLFPRGSRDDRVDLLSQCIDHHREAAPPPSAGNWKALTARLGRM